MKIIDFGLAKPLSPIEGASLESSGIDHPDNKTHSPGTPLYFSPEIASWRISHFNHVSRDIWAVGVILYQLVTLRMPFPPPSRDRQPLMLLIANEKYGLFFVLIISKVHKFSYSRPMDPIKEMCSPQLLDLISKLLMKQLESRISSIEKLTEHTWLENENE